MRLRVVLSPCEFERLSGLIEYGIHYVVLVPRNDCVPPWIQVKELSVTREEWAENWQNVVDKIQEK